MNETSMKLKILVGTMTRTTEGLAQAIQMDCADLVGDIELLMMDNLDVHAFSAANAKNALYIICTATYGQGDVPDNACALYESLAAEPQYLGHVRYGVMALGDRNYLQTFGFGAQKLDARLADRGAQRIGDVWCHDASTGTVPEEEGLVWCREWLTQALHGTTASSKTA